MKSIKAVINGKEYTVSFIFNMVGHYAFTDKNGEVYLIDGEDVIVWANENDIKYENIKTAIAYAEYAIGR